MMISGTPFIIMIAILIGIQFQREASLGSIFDAELIPPGEDKSIMIIPYSKTEIDSLKE